MRMDPIEPSLVGWGGGLLDAIERSCYICLVEVINKCGGWGAELFTCPYPLKVQGCPSRDQILATQSRGGKGKKGCY